MIPVLIYRMNSRLKKLEIKTQVRNVIIKERLKHYPKLHIQTDKRGEAIREYNNKPSKNKLKELKTKLREFHVELANWDANYCIFGGKDVTYNIGKMRKRLEKNKLKDEDITNLEGDETIYQYLLDIENALKEEMFIYYADEKEFKLDSKSKDLINKI